LGKRRTPAAITSGVAASIAAMFTNIDLVNVIWQAASAGLWLAAPLTRFGA
jgi:hypothetical protein